LKADGSIVAWGTNDALPSPNSDFIAIAAGGAHSLGLRRDGSIVAWGANDFGQTDVPGPNRGFVAIAAGDVHSLALKENGSVVGWGLNDKGQINVPEPNTGFIAIGAGEDYSLGIRKSEVMASLDIMPKKCPNRVKAHGSGLIRAALAGSDMFDVRQVDVDTLELRRADGIGEAIGPLLPKTPRGRETPLPPLSRGEAARSHAHAEKLRFRDVATFDSDDSCECGEDGSDGFDDLVLRFGKKDLIDAFELDAETPGASIEVTITGNMEDGTVFEASDCIVVGGRDND
jgi:hypothetical protein